MNTEYSKYEYRSSGPGAYILDTPVRNSLVVFTNSSSNRNSIGAPGYFVDQESSLRKLGLPNDRCFNGMHADVSKHLPGKQICFGDKTRSLFLSSIREQKPCNNNSYSFLDKRMEFLHVNPQDYSRIHDNGYIGYISRHDRRKNDF